MKTARFGIAGIVGTEIPVIAINRRPARALATSTRAGSRARIPIVAKEAVVGRDMTASSSLRGAIWHQADRPQALGRWTFDNRVRLYPTLVG